MRLVNITPKIQINLDNVEEVRLLCINQVLPMDLTSVVVDPNIVSEKSMLSEIKLIVLKPKVSDSFIDSQEVFFDIAEDPSVPRSISRVEYMSLRRDRICMTLLKMISGRMYMIPYSQYCMLTQPVNDDIIQQTIFHFTHIMR